MVLLRNILVVALAVGSGSPKLGLVQATQDAAHYFLPDNIYENLPPGVEIPEGAKKTSSGPPVARSENSPYAPVYNNNNNNQLFYGPEDPPSIDISTPKLNAIYTPGSSLVMAWNNPGIKFPSDWVPPKALMDTITEDPGFSHSPLLTPDDMVNLAKMKLDEMRQMQLSNQLKDSTIWLKHLRLISTVSVAGASASEPPHVLTDSGYSLSGATRQNLVSGIRGELVWRIPEDWNHEGEFEIVIPSVAGIRLNDTTSYSGAKSPSFWILRDAATREHYPSYSNENEKQTHFVGGTLSSGDLIQQQRQLGVFLGVIAMLAAFGLVIVGLVLHQYRKKWAQQQLQQQQMEEQHYHLRQHYLQQQQQQQYQQHQQQQQQLQQKQQPQASSSITRRSSTLSSESSVLTAKPSTSMRSPNRSTFGYGDNPFLTHAEIMQQHGVNNSSLHKDDNDGICNNPFDMVQGDEDAHSPVDLSPHEVDTRTSNTSEKEK
ncbi:hypothetical protein BGZ94_006880 [Podila epigama]|nr:hypothetical protein BGZ94_006880 [Podila epigama]